MTIDGKTLDELNLALSRDHSHPLAPPTEDRTMTIPGMHGAWDFGADMGPRPFTLPLMIKPQRSRSDVIAVIRKLITVFIDPYGRPKTVKLIFDYEPDVYIEARYSGSIPIERYFHTGTFDLPMTAFKPFKKFRVQSDEIIMDSDVAILSDIPWDTEYEEFTITSPQTIRIANNGTLAIPFTFKLVGSGTNVKLSANGKTMSLGTFSEKTIEVQENYTVKVDGATDLTHTNGVFLDLLPGSNSVAITGTSLDFTISESLTYQYI